MESIAGQGFRSVGDLYLLSRLRLTVDVRPTGWLSFRFQAEDSRVFGQNTRPAPASQKEAADLRVGYVEIGREDSLAALRVGRQSLDFGEGRLLADANWSNVGRTFDAARLTLRHALLRVDLFAGASVKIDPIAFDIPTPGEHFHGIYGSLGGLVPGASIEPYVFWRLEHNCKSESGKPGNADEKTLGFRWAGKLPWRFDYSAEVAGQSGSIAGDRIRAWAGHWAVGHTLPDARRRPRIFTDLNRASGDADPHDGVHGDFDPLFPSTHDKLGLTDLFTWANLLHWRAGFEYYVLPSLKLATAYDSFWLVNARGGLYMGGRIAARSINGSAGTHVGQEPDVQASWTPSTTTQVIAGYGRLLPCEFLQRTIAAAPSGVVFFAVAQRF